MKKSEIVEMATSKLESDGMKIAFKSAKGPVNILAIDDKGGIRAVEVLNRGERPSARPGLERGAIDALAKARTDLCGRTLIFARASLCAGSMLRFELNVTNRLSGRDEAKGEADGNIDPDCVMDALRLRPRALDAAARWLQQQRCSVLGRNYSCIDGRIDLVVFDEVVGDIALVKVEVVPKGVTEDPTARPCDARTMRALGESWAKAHDYPADRFRFDIVKVIVIDEGRALVRRELAAHNLQKTALAAS